MKLKDKLQFAIDDQNKYQELPDTAKVYLDYNDCLYEMLVDEHTVLTLKDFRDFLKEDS